ncbi:hypothetical protein CHARACLAT_031112 [Characodon lateralis]|uniref:Uncharacterized protein n=1 Tax=Characodon lateralis TaxID=208331 RepID=A0ABU7CTH0_9TELE|nr:hypothetical protein [Characodon lateralis]
MKCLKHCNTLRASTHQVLSNLQTPDVTFTDTRKESVNDVLRNSGLSPWVFSGCDVKVLQVYVTMSPLFRDLIHGKFLVLCMKMTMIQIVFSAGILPVNKWFPDVLPEGFS